ncbi:MAG TPA: hypothetical protein VJB06_00215, partial [archaeon]|nr:hypothetical protein [archaeon]
RYLKQVPRVDVEFNFVEEDGADEMKVGHSRDPEDRTIHMVLPKDPRHLVHYFRGSVLTFVREAYREGGWSPQHRMCFYFLASSEQHRRGFGTKEQDKQLAESIFEKEEIPYNPRFDLADTIFPALPPDAVWDVQPEDIEIATRLRDIFRRMYLEEMASYIRATGQYSRTEDGKPINLLECEPEDVTNLVDPPPQDVIELPDDLEDPSKRS